MSNISTSASSTSTPPHKRSSPLIRSASSWTPLRVTASPIPCCSSKACATSASPIRALARDKREGLMRTIATQVNQEASQFGVQIVDVRIKRVDLPEANMQAIYRRMQTERQRQAAEFRAEGEGAARRIRATADRQVTVIKADATGESERIRGDGDAERNRIYAKAFNQDPDFFAFYRSMQAYDAAQVQRYAALAEP